MKAFFVICILLSSHLVLFPSSATATQELHNVEHNGVKTNFPVIHGTGKKTPAGTVPTPCYKDGKYHDCHVPAPPLRGHCSVYDRDCTAKSGRMTSPCPCTAKGP
ncbi:hypothetical protein DITRI_Ditri13aG0032700 [Diplodiscus trichospermus]